MKIFFSLLLVFSITEVQASLLNCKTAPESNIRNIYYRLVSAEFNVGDHSPLSKINIVREKTKRVESFRQAHATQAVFQQNDPLKSDFTLFEITGRQVGPANSYFLALPVDKSESNFKAYLDIYFDYGHSGWSRQTLDCVVN